MLRQLAHVFGRAGAPGPCGCRWQRGLCESLVSHVPAASAGPADRDRYPTIYKWLDARTIGAGRPLRLRAGRISFRTCWRWAPPMSLITPLKIWVGGHLADFTQHGRLAARLDDSSLVSRDRAKRTAAETAAHDGDRIFDHVERRNGLAIVRMRLTSVWQPVDKVHRRLRNRQSRLVANNNLLVVPLDQRSGVVRIGLVVNDLGSFGKCRLITAYVRVTGNL